MSETKVANFDKTFQFDSELPSLPCPELEQTLIRYLDSIEFLLDAKEYERTVDSIKQFKLVGDVLQSKLQEKAKSNKNWVIF